MVRRLSDRGLAVLALTHALACLAQAGPAHNKLHRDDARNLHAQIASEARAKPAGGSELTYLVCNLATQGLVFRWDKPGFESGLAHPLGKDRCAVYQRDVARQREDLQASIRYTQRGETFDAAAYVDDPNFKQKIVNTWSTALRLVGRGPPYKQPDQRVDLHILVTDKGNRLQLQMRWSGPVDGVAARLPPGLDEPGQQQLRDELAQQAARGPDAQLRSADELRQQLAPLDRDRHAASVRDGWFVQARTSPGRPQDIVFTHATGPTDSAIGSEPVLVLDASGRVLAVLRYTTVVAR